MVIALPAAAAPVGAQARDPAPPAPAAVARWLGCYQLRRGDWRPAVDTAYELPPMVRLDSAPAPAASTRRRSWYSVQSEMPAFLARRPLLAVVGWRPIAGDSIAVSWFDGFVRITAALGARGDSLAGTVRWRRVTARLDSAGRAIPAVAARAPLVARRVPCPS